METYHFLYRLILRLYKYTYEVEEGGEGGQGGREGGAGAGGGTVLEDPIVGKRKGGKERGKEGGQGGREEQARALFEDTMEGGREGGKEGGNGGGWGEQKVYWLEYPLISGPVTYRESVRGRGRGREGRRRTPFAVSLVEGGGDRMLIIFRGREGGRMGPGEGGREK